MKRAETCKLRVHKGFPVDLSCAETYQILSTAQWRKNGKLAEILYNQEWWTLSRTDLKDDVGTTCWGEQSPKDYLAILAFGARLNRYPGGMFFAVVDRYSDG